MARPGSRGATVALQIHLSLCANVNFVSGFIQSPNKVTSVAFVARMRNVTRRSPCTSGETMGSSRGTCAQADAVARKNKLIKAFMINAVLECLFPGTRHVCRHYLRWE